MCGHLQSENSIGWVVSKSRNVNGLDTLFTIESRTDWENHITYFQLYTIKNTAKKKQFWGFVLKVPKFRFVFSPAFQSLISP